MSFTTHNSRFYPYIMPTNRPVFNENTMDGYDIDMPIPPPKPLRVSDIRNNNVTVTTQLPWITSTPKNKFKENNVTNAIPAATKLLAENCFAVTTETPKSIYSGGQLKGGNARTETTELQLRPKLHAVQKRWSSEMREKAFEIDKQNAEKNLQIQPAELSLQLKPQSPIRRNSLQFEIRQQVLEMSKRNSGSLQESPKAANTSMRFFEPNLNLIKSNQENSSYVQANVCSETAYKMDRPAGVKTLGINSDNEISFENIQDVSIGNVNQPQDTTATYTVKERIHFFNKLTAVPSNTFITLLKNCKTTKPASTHYSNNTQTKAKVPPTKMVLNLQQDISSFSEQHMQFPTNVPAFFASTTCNATPIDAMETRAPVTASSSSSSMPVQRKSNLRHKTLAEKVRHPISRQNSTTSSSGTKPQMHKVMEDLTLVIPVKLRIAEYERRITMAC